MSNVKILILKPRNHLYSRRLNGYSNLLLANIHRQLFTGKLHRHRQCEIYHGGCSLKLSRLRIRHGYWRPQPLESPHPQRMGLALQDLAARQDALAPRISRSLCSGMRH